MAMLCNFVAEQWASAVGFWVVEVLAQERARLLLTLRIPSAHCFGTLLGLSTDRAPVPGPLNSGKSGGATSPI